MRVSVQLVKNDIAPQLKRYAAEMRKPWPAVVRQTARGITRRVVDLTPPASAGVTGTAARKAGESKIARQMQQVLAPVKLKGRRRITHVFGRKLARPITVPTREKHPDVAALYRGELRARSGLGFTSGLRSAKFYVDERKFRAVFALRKSRVGRLASGWSAAALALDLPVQAWIGRHGTERGVVRLTSGEHSAGVVVRNLAPGIPPQLRAELARRVPYALQYQANAMERQIVAYHERVRGQLGLRGATRAALPA